jgi:hypothetical protein
MLYDIVARQTCLSKTETKQLHADFTVNAEKAQPWKAYFLPKVHKKDLSMRLICASCCWLTYLPSKYIAYVLQPVLKSLPSYIEDSASLVRILSKTQLAVYDQLITADVVALYPSIIIEDGLRSLHHVLTTRGWDKNKIRLILELTSWVLHNNVLTFNSKLFLQTKGTAMGTPLAVAYACIHLHVIEQESFDIFHRRGYSLRSIKLYVRFIDDIHFICTDYDHAKIFLDIFNGRRPLSIVLDFKIRNTSVDFLDLTIYKEKGLENPQVSLFQKHGNRFLFLPAMSFHPPHQNQGWIGGNIIRFRLNCSQEHAFKTALVNFKQQLRDRGYTDIHLDAAFLTLPDRQTLLTQTAATSTEVLGTPFITTYTTELSFSKKELMKALSITPGYEQHPDIEYVLGGRNKPLLCLKREKSLRDMLVRAKL